VAAPPADDPIQTTQFIPSAAGKDKRKMQIELIP